MVQRIATVAVYVEDQTEALIFWRGRMGFEVMVQQATGVAGDWLEVAPPGAESRLVVYPNSLMSNWEELKPSIVIECEDMESTFQLLKSRRVEFLEDPKKMAWGTYARFRDPDGNEFLLKGL